MNFLLAEDASNIFTRIFDTIPQLIYYICSCCLMVLDFAQIIFRKLVGLDAYYIDGLPAHNPMDPSDTTMGGDVLLQLIQKVFINEEYSAVKTTFISLIILSAILLVVTTIAAILRNEYSPDKEKKNSKAGIIKNCFKAVASFFLIPIAAFFGVWFGNAALYAIDAASSPQSNSLVTLDSNISSKLVKDSETGSYIYYSFFDTQASSRFAPMSAIASRTALYTANKLRRDESFYIKVIQDSEDSSTTRHFDILNQYKQQTQARLKAAACLDDLFMMNAKLKSPNNIDRTIYEDRGAFGFPDTVQYFDRYNVGLVSYYYNLWWYMFPAAIIYIMMAWKTLVTMVFGLLSRIITIFGLIFIEPILCAIMPLDGGSSLTGWRKQFVSQLISAYVAVLVFNVFYLIYPIITSISIFGGGTLLKSFPDMMFQLFVLIAAIQAIGSLDKTIEKLLGRDDKSSFFDDGGKTYGAVKENAVKTWNATKGAARIAGGAVMAGVGLAATGIGAGAGLIGNISNKIKESGLKKKRDNNAKIAARTDDQLKNDAINKTKQSKTYEDEYNKRVAAKMDDEFTKYQSAGGLLSREAWESGRAMGEGSYNSAVEKWNQLTDDEKIKFKGRDDFLEQEYAKTSGYTDFNEWRREGDIARLEQSDSNLATLDGQSAKMRATNYTQDEMNKEIETAINTGVGTSDLAAEALKQHKAQVDERETARNNIPQYEADYQRQKQKNKNARRVAKNTRFGRAVLGAGVRTIFRKKDGK